MSTKGTIGQNHLYDQIQFILNNAITKVANLISYDYELVAMFNTCVMGQFFF